MYENYLLPKWLKVGIMYLEHCEGSPNYAAVILID
jgi:hypothetical protein